MYNSTINEIISQAGNSNIRFLLKSGKLTLQVPKNVQVNDKLLQLIRENKELIRDYLQQHEGNGNGNGHDLRHIQPAAKDGLQRIPLSYAQAGLWFVHNLEGSVQYHMPSLFRLRGALNAALLEASFREIVARHEILRTIILEEQGEGYQSVKEATGWKLQLTEAAQIISTGKNIEEYIEEWIASPFDLAADYMLRAVLIHEGSDAHILVIVIHHIAFDEWSVDLLVREISELYTSKTQDREARLQPLTLQYSDYAIWQRNYLSGDLLKRHLAYWKQQLQDTEQLVLFTDKARQNKPGIKGDVISTVISDSLRRQLHQLCVSEGASSFMVLVSVFKILLHRYTGCTDICTGTPISGRMQLQEVENLIGYFVNMLALRDKVNSEDSFRSFLQQVRATILGAYEHQDVPFDKVVEALDLPRESGTNPLFQVTCVLKNAATAVASLGDIRLEEEQVDHSIKFDLSLEISEMEGHLQLSMLYRDDLFNPGTIGRMLSHYVRLLQQVCANPDVLLNDLQLLTETEERQINIFNDTAAPYPADQNIIDVFSAQVLASPDALALVFDDESYTYRQLDEITNQFARYLQHSGVRHQEPVPVCLHRSASLIISIIAILKAGGAYVPIDPSYPADRIAYMLHDIGAKIIFTNSHAHALIPESVQQVTIDAIWPLVEMQPVTDLNVMTQPSSLAYILYTSGSTGTPKGVMVEHGNVVSLVKGTRFVKLDGDTVLLSTGSPSFDATTIEYWGALLNGGRLLMCSHEVLFDIKKLKSLVRKEQVNTMWFTAGWFNQLVESDSSLFATLETVMAGGDRLSVQHVAQLKERYPHLRIINGYGPTENTTFSLTYPIQKIPQADIPIGMPLENRTAYVLDEGLQVCAFGVPGELFVGGAGLARGYWKQEALTAERFIIHPDFGRLYKTGDQARRLPDGNIEFLGRRDQQVKVRGYRVEPGEIENALLAIPGIRQAVVIAKAGAHGDNNTMLVAYYVAQDALGKDVVLKNLEATLPNYMVPAVLVQLDELPLTANGKVDRKRLPATGSEDSTGDHVLPRNETEQKLARIWQELLELEQVGIHDNFFELGGHSLLAIRVIAAVRAALQQEVTIKDIFDKPTIAGLASVIARDTTPGMRILTRYERPQHIPLSFAQERLWFIDKLEGSVQYNMPWIFRLNGDLNITALQSAFREIVNRHEILRTVIREDEGDAYQLVQPAGEWSMNMITQHNNLDARLEQLVLQPFNLAEDSLLRVHLAQLAPQEFVLLVVIHHIAFDGWSISLMVQELTALYECFAKEKLPALPELPVQYADYALWQRDFLSTENLQEGLTYWKQQLRDVNALELPLDYIRPPVQSTSGRVAQVFISKTTTRELVQFFRQEDATLFMGLLAVMKLLLYRYSGQHDICVGTVVAGREDRQTEKLIGFFVNTLALRTQLDPASTVRELIRQVKQTTLDAYSHQQVPFEKIVEAVAPDRNRDRSPLFQVLFALLNTPSHSELALGDVSLAVEMPAQASAKFDLHFDVIETPDGLQIDCTYCTALFSEATILRMLKHYEQLLQVVCKEADTSISTIPLLLAEEKEQIVQFNNTSAYYPASENIVSLFAQQAFQTPDAIALVFEEEVYTYAQLDECTNKLSNYLLSKGVRQEMPVPVCLYRSASLMIAILSILKAGGAYVPIDPDYPADRIAYMLNDIEAQIIITQNNITAPIPAGIEKILMDDDWDVINQQPDLLPVVRLAPKSLAYIIFTSGSTGKPKGVMVEHGSIVCLVKNVNYVSLDSKKILLATCSPSFDVSTLEYWGMLLNGGKLVFCSQEVLMDARLLKEVIRKQAVNMMWFTSGYFNQLADTDPALFETLETVIAGGDRLSVQHIGMVRRRYPGMRIINGYGPTENTTFSLTYDIKEILPGRDIPIGTPMENRTAYILNEGLQLCPVGVVGEICAGGAGLARGYWKQAALTAERFVEVTGIGRIYRTGDLGRWMPDGNIEFLGRRDDQVKIRGFRVELGEIESVLQEAPGVSNAVVVARADAGNNKQLVAYFVGDGNKVAIQEYLQSALPAYMIPAVLVPLQELPLTANGKIDKKRLPDTGISFSQDQYEAPRTAIEEKLAAIWQTMLGVHRIGIHDNFFTAGGHSLLAMRIMAAIRRQLNADIPVRELFNNPTVAGIASLISKQETVFDEPIVKREQGAPVPLSFAQERLWFIDKLQGSRQFNMPWLFHLQGPLNADALTAAFEKIVARHEILRTVVHESNGTGYQHICAAEEWKMLRVDAADLLNEEEFIQSVINRAYDLANELPLRVVLVKRSAKEHMLLTVVHHIAFDAWSIRIIVNELVSLYAAFTRGEQASLKPLPVQYADYACWQRKHLARTALQQKLDAWKQQLLGFEELMLPADQHLVTSGAEGGLVQQTLSPDLLQRLSLLMQSQGATLFMGMLSVFKLLLYKYTGQTDICVGTSVNLREQEELQGLAGFFTNLLALRTRFDDKDSFAGLLQNVKRTTSLAYSMQDVPFEQVVEALDLPRQTGRSPIFNTICVLHETPSVEAMQLQDLQVIDAETGEWLSEFDLWLEIQRSSRETRLSLRYRTALFSKDRVTRMLEHYLLLLQEVCADAEKPLNSFSLLSSSEAKKIKTAFNNTRTDYPAHSTIVQVFTVQAWLTPNAVALAFEDERYTYAELHTLSNQLAHYLIAWGVKPGDPVPVCIQRSAQLIIAILALLKAGGAYVPIDPDYPADRIAYMLQDIEARFIVARSDVELQLPDGIYRLDTDVQQKNIAKESPVAPDVNIHAASLAYIMYTSGSTGTPKGVMVEHGNVVSLVKGVDYVPLNEKTVLLSTGSPSFDATTIEYWGTLLNGGKLLLCRQQQLFDTTQLKAIIQQEKVNTMWFTAGWFSQLAETDSRVFETLNTVIAGGDRLSVQHIGKVRQLYPHLQMVNGYGPTENTTFSLTYDIQEIIEGREIPIGIPLPNRRAYILDDGLELCAIGLAGEICVGGAGLARGYWKQPALTNERFIEVEGLGRLYRTGDIGRWLPDGNIEYLGRRDAQVKIRGYRVELGEIETVLQSIQGVRQAAVTAKQDESNSNNKKLVAYLVTGELYGKEAMLEKLRSQLPDYMIPVAFVELEELPLTPNGKVDKNRLPDPVSNETGHEYLAPRNETERQIANIWQELLEVERVGIHDNFFELGGHSLLAIRLIAAIRQALKQEIAIKYIFDHPTIAGLSEVLQAGHEDSLLPAIAAIERPQRIPLSFAQERLWFIDKLQGSAQFNMPWLFRLRGRLDTTALETSFKTIIHRHEVLRTLLREEAGEGYQLITDAGEWRMNVVKAETLKGITPDEYLSTEMQRPFDLGSDLKMRVSLVQISTEDYLLLVVLHHIAFDGWSIALMVQELKALYSANIKGQAASLKQLPVQYADFAIWQRQHSADTNKLAYWKDQLSGISPLELPLDFARPLNASMQGGQVQKFIAKKTADGLRQLSKKHGATLFMTLLSVYKILLYRYTSQVDICVGSSTGARGQKETEDLIGFFVNLLALRTGLQPQQNFASLLEDVKQTALAALAHQEVPFEKIVEALDVDRDMSRNPVFQVTFVLHNVPQPDDLYLGDVHLQYLDAGQVTSEFDWCLEVREEKQGLQLDLRYKSSLFSNGTMLRVLDHYEQLLQAVLEDDALPVQQLNMLTTGEWQQQAVFNQTTHEYPRQANIPALFAEQVQKHAERTALVLAGEQLSYAELDNRSNQLANYILAAGIKQGERVGLLSHRCTGMIVSMLGILKTGAVYVPFNTAYPAERLQYLMEDANIRFVVYTDEALFANAGLDSACGLPIHSLENFPAIAPKINIDAGAGAYIMYTSGTTGNSKGILVSHRNVVKLAHDPGDIRVVQEDNVLQWSNYAFDGSVYEIFNTLLNGACLHLIPGEAAADADALASIIETENITVWFVTTALFNATVDANVQSLKGLRKLLFGGEQVSAPHVQKALDVLGGGKLVHVYGPTETTVYATAHPVNEVSDGIVPIGKPLANTKALVLDAAMQPVAAGVTGELYIGGDGVATGYLNNPALEQEKFIEINGLGRCYRTGDFVRRLPDGNIVFIGRKDNQVKVRGYRIELGEIETALQLAPGVRHCIVIAREDKHGTRRLIGYVTACDNWSMAGTREWLAASLPDYMIPDVIMQLENMPLNANGKIDRKQLPDPDSASINSIYVAPRNAIEEQLAAIWQDLLEIERVGIHDNFFELGGHSLLVIRLMSAIRKDMQKEIAIKDVFDHPTIAGLQAIIQQNDAQLMHAITRHTGDERRPLSFAQERLWFIHKLQGSTQYHMPWVFRLSGNLDIQALEWSFRQILQRHEVLRTVIAEENGSGYQLLTEAESWTLNHVHANELVSNKKTIEEYITDYINHPYALDKDAVLRVSLVQLTEQEYLMVAVLHHIAFDGWSISIMVKELMEFYEAKTAHRTPVLNELPVQYGDYAIWQRHWLAGERLQIKLEYWTQQLQQVSPLALPVDFKRPATQSVRGGQVHRLVSRELLQRLHEFSHQHELTLFMTLLGAFKVMLYRYTGQQDICVGTPVAGRHQQELEGLIGFFVNTLALRSEVRGGEGLLTFLRELKQTVLQAYEHQEVPFEKIVEALGVERDTSRTPVFQVMFALQNIPRAKELSFGGVVLSEEPQPQLTSKFEIGLYINESEEGLALNMTYCSDLYAPETISRMLGHYEMLLQQMVEHSTMPVGQMPMLLAEEKQWLLEAGEKAVAYPTSINVIAAFEQQVANTPGATAVVFEDQQLTYQALDQRAAQLCGYLISAGVQPGSFVGICLDEGPGTIVAILAILKSGAAYVPVDTSIPLARMQFIIGDTNMQVMITDRNVAPEGLTGVRLILLDEQPPLQQKDATSLTSTISPDSLIYVIYTSGSTGTPKGVMVKHRGIMDYVHGLDDATGISNCRSFALVSGIATDLGNTVLYSALLFGGALHLFSKNSVTQAQQLHDYFQARNIDCIKIVPSHWKALQLGNKGLLPEKLLIFGGEILPADTVAMIHEGGNCTVVNHYGPTETTIGKLLHVTVPGRIYGDIIPIGKPFSNTSIRVLSPDGDLCPIGVSGELYIGGDGVAAGYINNLTLTQTRFVEHEGKVYYRTGDQVKYLPDGNILFLGRIDDQVKIRGYRVEPEEVRAVLEQCPGVKQGAVIVQADESGEKQLIAYIVTKGSFDQQQASAFLAERLPAYMIPAQLVQLDNIPLTGNGKIDRKKLPAVQQPARSTRFEAPRNLIEMQLAIIWQELLNKERIGIHDNFFEKGGHSLLAIRLISAIRTSFGKEVMIRTIFDHATIASLALQLQHSSAQDLPPVVKADRSKSLPLSFAQERLWFIDRLQGSTQYHMPYLFRLHGELNATAMEQALQQLVQQHEVLRTVVHETGGKAFQVVMPIGNLQLQLVEAAAIDNADQYIDAFIRKPFDLSKDCMLRVMALRISSAEHLLVLVLHHIAFDAWSMPVLVQELAASYNAIIKGPAYPGKELEAQYADFAVWQREYLSGERLETKLEWWRKHLQPVEPLALLTDYPRPVEQSTKGDFVQTKLGADTTRRLTEFCRREGLTPFMFLLGVYKILLHRHTGQRNICVGVAVAGRQQMEVEGLIGFFINMLAINTEINGEEACSTWLQQLRQTALTAYEHQDVPFEKVVDALNVERDMSRTPVFQAAFVYQNTPETPAVQLDGLTLERVSPKELAAKFELTLDATETESGLQLTFSYCKDLFSKAAMSRLLDHFTQLMEAVLINAGITIDRLPMMTQEEQELLDAFSNGHVSSVPTFNIVEWFETQVEQTPDSIAVVSEKGSISYRELNMRANKLANYLLQQGMQPESLAMVCANRGEELIIGILAVVKSGSAYIPVDPGYPAARIAYMAGDSGAGFILTTKDYSNSVAGVAAKVIDIDGEDYKDFPAQNPGIPIDTNSLAYVIYTSGTTGNPKGVMIAHKSLVNLVSWHHRVYELDQHSKCTLLAGVGFDASVWEMWPSLLCGASLLIIQNEQRLEVDSLVELFKQHAITHSFVPTALAREFVSHSRNVKDLSLKFLLTGGDKLGHLDLTGLTYAVVNNYGPTENTVVASYYTLNGGAPLIGRPVDNVQLYLLDDHNTPVPVGVAGELCIGGEQLALGYLNQPALTEEKFVPHPFIQNKRIYRTGDLARWMPDGNIAFLGRKDDQLKIRGYRVEPAEIEQVLLEAPGVQQAVVIAKEDHHGSRQLAAFVTTTKPFAKEMAIDFLRMKLPAYMVPGQVSVLDEIPLTPNGKIDYRQLASIDDSQERQQGYAAPQTACQRKLVAIWEGLIGVSPIGIHDNFFELGGDSIVTIQVVSRAKQAGYSIQPKDIFTHQTISSLSVLIESRSGMTQQANAEQGILTGAAGMLPIQHWYFEQASQDISHYNQSLLLAVNKNIQPNVVATALQHLVQHHDALRFKYKQENNNWQQEYGTAAATVEVVDIMHIPASRLQTEIENICNRCQQQLDIENGKLVHAAFIQTNITEEHNRLFIAIHHLAVDGVSWRILLSDLEMLARALMSGSSLSLGAKTNSYREWQQALQRLAADPVMQEQKSYWLNLCRKQTPLPQDTGLADAKSNGSYRTRLSKDLTQRLLQQSGKAYNTNVNDLLLAALAQSLCHWSGRDSIIIGLEGHGREEELTGLDVSRTVGWFTVLYPVLIEIEDAPDGDVIRSVKEQLRKVPHKGLGWGMLKYLHGDEEIARLNDPWEITFNYLGQADNITQQSDLFSIAGEPSGDPISPQAPQRNKLEISAIVIDGELAITCKYISSFYKPATIIGITEEFAQDLERFIMHCTMLDKNMVRPTPSDFNLPATIHYKELDHFLDQTVDGSEKPASIEAIYPLSGLQEGMLFHGLFDTGAVAYINQFGCRLQAVNETLFAKSWNALLQQHTILRTSFHHDAFEIPVQAVHARANLPLTLLDWRSMSAEEQQSGLASYREADRHQQFAFEKAPLMRVALIRMSDSDYYMLWTYHHLILDGWSKPLLMRSFLNLYESFLAGNQAIPATVDRYEDYIRYLAGIDAKQEEHFWRNYLNGLEAPSFLPFIASADRNKAAGSYNEVVLQFDEQQTELMQAYAQQHRITVNTLLQATWSYLLHQYTGSSNICFGIIVSGRPGDLAAVEQRLGMYINTIPLHNSLQETHTVQEWLQQLQQRQADTAQYQYTPLSRIGEWSGITGNLFDTIMVFENYPVDDILYSGNWQLQASATEVYEHTNYPLSIEMSMGETISIRFVYNESLLHHVYVQNMCAHFKHVLAQLTGNAGCRIAELELITPLETIQIMQEFNGRTGFYPAQKTVPQLLDEQAAATPAAIAIIAGAEKITYNELQERSDRLASYLVQCGVKKDSLVPLFMERSAYLVIAIVATWKAGGAYVPLDPLHPAERLALMIADTRAAVVITDRIDAALTDAAGSATIITLNEQLFKELPAANSLQRISPAGLAYVIYTSGSTGKPKGAMIEHAGMLNHLYAKINELKISSQSLIAQTASYTFDISVWQLFAALLCGGTTVIYNDDIISDPRLLLRNLEKDQVTIAELVPSYLLSVLEQDEQQPLTHLQYLLVTGEAVSAALLEDWFRRYPKKKVVNAYGPTEAADDICHHHMATAPAAANVPVGKPVQNMQVYIMNAKGKLQPPGVAGEIIVSGIGVGRGYWNDAEKTSRSFGLDPFSKDSRRLYRTGDQGRWLPDGSIEYLGRIDEQVKIRGYRIEPGEIEQALQQAPGIRQAIVVVKQDDQGTRRLIAYVVATEDYEKNIVEEFLSRRLPAYMLPSFIMQLNEMPLTANGKVDKKRLPDAVMQMQAAASYEAPQSEIEIQLAGIWQELLGIERAGIHDNFFESGGQSLLAMRMIAYIKKRFSLAIPIHAIFQFPTINELGKYIALELAKHQPAATGADYEVFQI